MCHVCGPTTWRCPDCHGCKVKFTIRHKSGKTEMLQRQITSERSLNIWASIEGRKNHFIFFPLSIRFILMVILMHSVHFCVFCPQHNARFPSHVFSIFLEELLNEFTTCQLKSFQGFVCKRWPLLCRAIQLSINNPSFQGGRWCLCSRDPRPVLQVLLRQEVQDVRDQDCRDRRDCPGAGFCDLIKWKVDHFGWSCKERWLAEETVKQSQILNEWARS